MEWTDWKNITAEQTNHINARNNPHDVTLEQIGGAPVNHRHVDSDIGSAAWQMATLVNGFTTALTTPPQFRREPGNVVSMRGCFGHPTANTGIVFTLPVGFRPEFRHHVMFSVTAPNSVFPGTRTTGALWISPNGQVSIGYALGANAGITWWDITCSFQQIA